MVWWFAVPIFHLFRPYQAVQAVWFCSAPERDGIESASQDGVLTIWWTGWVALTLWDTTQLLIGKVDPHTHNMLAIITGVVGAAACFAALAMVRALQRRQVQRARELRH